MVHILMQEAVREGNPAVGLGDLIESLLEPMARQARQATLSAIANAS
jgi:hypothetical protein